MTPVMMQRLYAMHLCVFGSATPKVIVGCWSLIGRLFRPTVLSCLRWVRTKAKATLLSELLSYLWLPPVSNTKDCCSPGSIVALRQGVAFQSEICAKFYLPVESQSGTIKRPHVSVCRVVSRVALFDPLRPGIMVLGVADAVDCILSGIVSPIAELSL